MNRARVQELRNVIAGIPEWQINLESYYLKDDAPCGTIACIAGWAAIYPPFVQQGLHKNEFGAPAVGNQWGQLVVATFFDVSDETFSGRKENESGTDKEVALARLDKLLEE